MDIFLDIGFTILGGPKLSPPKKIAEILQLDASYLEIIRNIIFCENHTSVESLIFSLGSKIQREVNIEEEKKIQSFWQNQKEAAYPLEGAESLLKYLNEAEDRIHIVSNLWYPFYEKFFELVSKLQIRISSETLSFSEGIKKPSPQFYKIALAKAGALPELSIMIGDSIDNDITPCIQLGMNKCIWLESRPGYEKLPESFDINEKNVFVADSLEGIIQILIKIKKEATLLVS